MGGTVRVLMNKPTFDYAAAVDSSMDTTSGGDNNVFDEVAIGRVLSSAFGRDLAVSSPPRAVGVNLSKSF